MKYGGRGKFTSVCVSKIRGNVEHAMLTTVYGSCNGGARVSVMYWDVFVKTGWVESQM
jgi:hypothetical protein